MAGLNWHIRIEEEGFFLEGRRSFDKSPLRCDDEPRSPGQADDSEILQISGMDPYIIPANDLHNLHGQSPMGKSWLG